MTLDELVKRDHCAMLCMEMQRGVVGDLAVISGLSDIVRETKLVQHCARLFDAARSAQLPVIHLTAGFRHDRAGSYQNVPLVKIRWRVIERFVRSRVR